MFKTILLAGAAVLLCSGAAFADHVDEGGIFATPTGWGGFYVGMNGGYGTGTASDGNDAFQDVDLAGQLVGGEAGYNFVLMDGVVAGIQADMDWSNETGKIGGTGTKIGTFNDATLTDQVKWNGAMTGRLGAYFGPVMVYALAGLSVMSNTLDNVGVDQLQGNSPIESSIDQTHIGWTAGGGFSVMAGPFSGFVEYRYGDYGTANYAAAVGSTPVRLIDQQVRVGIDYHKQ